MLEASVNSDFGNGASRIDTPNRIVITHTHGRQGPHVALEFGEALAPVFLLYQFCHAGFEIS